MDSRLPPLDVTEAERKRALWVWRNNCDGDEGEDLAALYCRERQLEDALTRLEKAKELLRKCYVEVPQRDPLRIQIMQFVRAER